MFLCWTMFITKMRPSTVIQMIARLVHLSLLSDLLTEFMNMEGMRNNKQNTIHKLSHGFPLESILFLFESEWSHKPTNIPGKTHLAGGPPPSNKGDVAYESPTHTEKSCGVNIIPKQGICLFYGRILAPCGNLTQLLNMAICSEFSYGKQWCSIVMLVYLRVNCVCWVMVNDSHQ